MLKPLSLHQKRKKKICLLTPTLLWVIIFILLSVTYNHAQTSNSASKLLPNVIPPSPTVAALGKYVEIPVSPYTGVPSIDIALYEITSRDIKVPISLSYHAGGNRVEEEASWVGLGWSLNAGGTIGRTIRGRDDFSYYLNSKSTIPMPDFVYPGFNKSCYDVIAGGQHVDYCQEPPNEQTDWEPDAFFFNFLSRSGKFVLDQQGLPHLIEQTKIKIISTAGGQGFIIRTADGFRYDFFAAQMTNAGVDSWYLSKITSPQGEKVTFSYDRPVTTVYGISSLTQVENKETTGGCPIGLVDGAAGAVPSVSILYLSRIDFSTGHITFERDTQAREDLHNGERLKSIKVYQRDSSVPIKHFELISSYFISPTEQRGSGNYSSSIDEHNFAGKRLRLDQIVEHGNGQDKPPYLFSYNSTTLPYKTSFSRDHWGFFNGASNNTLVPGFTGISPISNSYVNFTGADREPNPTLTTAAILERIQYPNGGKTTFTYEPNEYGNMNNDDLYPWRTRTITAYQRSFPNNPLDTQGPSQFTVGTSSSMVGGGSPANVLIQLNIQGCYQNCQDDYTYVQIRQLNGSFNTSWSVTNTGMGTFSRLVTLPPGRYELVAKAGSGAAKFAWVQVELKEKAFVASYKKIGGGVRIAAISNENAIANTPVLIRKYKYDKVVTDSIGTHISSQGILMSRPRYIGYVQRPYIFSLPAPTSGGGGGGTGNNTTLSVGLCQAFQVCSYSGSQLSSSAKGASIGYSQVEEWQGEQAEAGKTVYQYENEQDIIYDYLERAPTIPNIPNPLNGYMRSKTDYCYKNERFFKVNEINYNYDYNKSNTMLIHGVARGPITVINLGAFYCAACDVPLHSYTIASNLIQQTYSTERRYDALDDTRFLQTTTSYSYDIGNVGHMQLSQTQTQRSDGSTSVTRMTYPADYVAVASGPLADMRTDSIYQHSSIIESITSMYGPGETIAQAKILAGTYIEYAKPNSISRYLPVIHQALELDQPSTSLVIPTTSLPPIGRYVPQIKLSYDPITANLQQVQKIHDVPTSYVWSYKNTLPVAAVQNASDSQIKIALAALGIDLMQSYTDQQLRAAFNQLRQRLPQARITNYTYQPLVGMTSQTGPDGRTMFYEYDGLGRLVRTRDEQNRILSQQQYHYAGQP